MIRRALALSTFVFLAPVALSQVTRAGIQGDHLLTTEWGDGKPFTRFTPADTTLGCHSVAAAQVMYFHRLAPHGAVVYTCTNGTTISEDFSDYAPQWESFVAVSTRQDQAEVEAAEREAAKFIYYTATIVRKDFGTDQYVEYSGDLHKASLESHFDCTVTPHTRVVESGIGSALSSEPSIYSLLQSEIAASRPVGFYYTDHDGGGHAVVIDGHVIRDGKHLFHVNFGWVGRSNGWYVLEEDLPKDTKEVSVIVIVPSSKSPADSQAPNADGDT